MNNRSNPTANEGTTVTIEAATSRYGNAQPQVTVQMPRGTHYRRLSAALYELAAKIERATPEYERWVLAVEATSDERGRIYLELSDASEEEAARALEVLRKAAR